MYGLKSAHVCAGQHSLCSSLRIIPSVSFSSHENIHFKNAARNFRCCCFSFLSSHCNHEHSMLCLVTSKIFITVSNPPTVRSVRSTAQKATFRAKSELEREKQRPTTHTQKNALWHRFDCMCCGHRVVVEMHRIFHKVQHFKMCSLKD